MPSVLTDWFPYQAWDDYMAVRGRWTKEETGIGEDTGTSQDAQTL